MDIHHSSAENSNTTSKYTIIRKLKQLDGIAHNRIEDGMHTPKERCQVNPEGAAFG